MGNQDWKKDVPLRYLARNYIKQHSIEALAIHRCPMGKTPWFDNAHFPWTSELEKAAPQIIREYNHMESVVRRIPPIQELSPEQGFISKDDNWKTFILKTYAGKSSPLAEELCPTTMRALERIPGVRVAFFSILEAGKTLPAHRGPYAGILRCHLGIRVPSEKERCKIRVGKEWRHWEQGKAMVFDDSYEHEVNNATRERRVVLFIDFVRPLRAPFDAINRYILQRFMDEAPFAKAFEMRQAKWEESVRAMWAEMKREDANDDVRAAAE